MYIFDPRDFDRWNARKKKIDSSEERAGFKVRDIWYLHMGKNVGFEQDGKGDTFLRPVIIFRKFNQEVFWGIPLTGVHKKGPYYQIIPDINGRENSAILSQLRLYDSKRLSHQIGVLEESVFGEIKQRLNDLILSAGEPRIETPRTRRGSARRRLHGKRNK